MNKCKIAVGIRKNGVRYKAGSIVELTDTEIARLGGIVTIMESVPEATKETGKEIKAPKGGEQSKLPETEKTTEKIETQTIKGDK
ncbi:MAG: hypothetical protein M9949_14180 [Candidatus Kapabacteria bacterium]|nr:hypothetical protein [Candidatus Kapabacteria bacterium]